MANRAQVDLKKTVPAYAARHGHLDIVDIPPMRYLGADAEGAPEGESFAGALGALFPLAYAVKFASKRDKGRDYVVPLLEELHKVLDGAGLVLTGKHHEIYLSDFRRTAPEKLRTILRQPGRAPG